jgi:tRNA threonylcarbamoyladenosine biosynthesis protein TsaB
MAIAACGPAGDAGWVGPGGAAASATLLVRVHEVLAAAGLSLPDLDAIAFGAGPGAFTGLRTACAVAQGLAFGLDRPVLAIDSLALVAEDTGWHDGAPVWVAADARMDELYAAAYRWDGAGWALWSPDTAPALVPLDVLAARWSAQPPARVAGSGLRAFGDRLPTGNAELCPVEHDRAAALRRCALQAWSRGAAVDAAQALPVYLRDKVALTTEERAAAAAARAAAAGVPTT